MRCHMKNKQKTLRCMDAPVYRYWQALYMAFYSRRLYVDVAKRWRGFGLFYLLLLIGVASIPLSLHLIRDFNHYFNDQMMLPLENIPPMKVQKGEFIFDEPMPYFIKNKAGVVVGMIDTRTNVSSMDSAYPELVVQITKNNFMFRTPPFKLFFDTDDQPIKLPLIKTLNKTDSRTFIAKEVVDVPAVFSVKWLTDIMIYPLVVSSIFGFCIVFILAFSMLAQVISWLILKHRLRYKEACRLVVMTSTTYLSFFLLLLSAHLVFPGIELFCLALGAVYFSYAVLSVKRDSQRMVRV